MEKKYYDFITELVKQNEKFPGCEPILDDIVEDVYEHSKIVLSSVTNEDVIKAYLTKVVATSVITVPKKLNFNTKNKHRIINTIHTIVEEKMPEVNNIALEIHDNNVNVDDTLLEEIAQVDYSEPENLLIEESEEEQTTENQPVIEPEEVLETESLANQEEEEEKSITESPLEFNESLQLEDLSEEEPLTAEQEEITTEDEVETLNIDTEALDIAAETSIEETEIIEPAEQTVDKTLVDKMINGVSGVEENENEEDFLLAESSEELVVEEPEILEANNEEILDNGLTLELEMDNADELIAEEQTIIESDEVETLEDLSLDLNVANQGELELSAADDTIEPPSYDCFSYTPEHTDINSEEICNILKEYSEKHPDKKLLKICKLKYEDKLSVSEIAEELGISESNVLEVLGDIIELVKD